MDKKPHEVTLDMRDYVKKDLYDDLVRIADHQRGHIEMLKNHQESLEKTLEEQGKKNKKLMDRHSLLERFLEEDWGKVKNEQG